MPGKGLKLENSQHSGVAQGVWFNTFQVQELRYTGIVGAQELLVDLGFHRSAFDHLEAMFSKKFSLKCEAKNSFNSKTLSSFNYRFHKLVADPRFVQPLNPVSYTHLTLPTIYSV